MSRTGTKYLFKLIHSMTKAEKRYFKLYASSMGLSKNYKIYILLFDLIEKQEKYDEKELIQVFKNKKLEISFSTTKSRLYDSIMKSLRAFHAGNSVDTRLRALLQNAEILH